MKKITNQKIDIPKLFERYITYICSSYKGYDFEDQLKSARRFIRDFYPNKKLIKNLQPLFISHTPNSVIFETNS